MFCKFRKRRKSMGANTQADTGAIIKRDERSRTRLILDFFSRSRRRRKEQIREGADDVGSARVPDVETTARQNISGTDDQTADHLLPDQKDTTTNSNPRPSHGLLTDADIQQLFSGAPQFSAQVIDGQVAVSASFPWNFDLETRDLRDAKSIIHAAFSGCTLHSHLPQLGIEDQRQAITYDIGVRESPSMLGSTGNELGTVGIGFFVQEPDADITNPQIGTQNSDDIFEQFSNFELLESQPEKLGIRNFDFAAVVERLVELSTTYEATAEKERALHILNRAGNGELYAGLFGKVLIPPKYDNTNTDPTGLKVQIEALLRILNLKRVWYDFSNVEWRIRIGQLLFSDGTADMADSKLSEPEDGLSERDVVLLQLLLSCELYVRLEAVATLGTDEITNIVKLTADEVNGFHGLESRKSKWDLVLARSFLNNIDAKTFMRQKIVPRSESSLTKTLLGFGRKESLVKIDALDIVLEPRRQSMQVDGLFHFADMLNWPDIQLLREHFTAALSTASSMVDPASPSIYATPLSTPGTMTPRSFRSDRESGYFASAVGSASPEMTPRSFQLQPPSRLDLDAAAGDSVQFTTTQHSIGGWLTRSYLTGLIMPGEAICHLLISALLENDADAIAALGENANLYGGFVYKGRSFWSKSCAVGRVLASLDGSRECMGWISCELVPEGYSDGWLDAYSAPVALKAVHAEGGAFEQSTHFLGGSTVTTVGSGDLILPIDEWQPLVNSQIRLESFRLEPNTPTTTNPMASEPVLSASLEFVIEPQEDLDTQSKDVQTIPLSHLVQFVSAYPCTPPAVAITKPLCSTDSENGVRLVSPAHPLHRSYKHRLVQLKDLLDPKLNIDHANGLEVIVIDARGDSSHDLLARSWCSSVGLDAVISRVGITCLSCAIREAKGLRIQIVIRVSAKRSD